MRMQHTYQTHERAALIYLKVVCLDELAQRQPRNNNLPGRQESATLYGLLVCLAGMVVILGERCYLNFF